LLDSLDDAQRRRFGLILHRSAQRDTLWSPWSGMLAHVRQSIAAAQAGRP
jgi:hypothetical protein